MRLIHDEISVGSYFWSIALFVGVVFIRVNVRVNPLAVNLIPYRPIRITTEDQTEEDPYQAPNKKPLPMLCAAIERGKRSQQGTSRNEDRKGQG